MKLHELKASTGARKGKVRLGRGTGSGVGKTSGRGHKGQKARSGGGVRAGFEGGQMPIYRRLPKRGFKNIRRKEYAAVNVERLNVFESGATVRAVDLVEAGLVKKVRDGIRILGNGKLAKSLHVKAQGFTKSAIQKIESAGGSAEVI